MLEPDAPIGIFDSGLGGLTVAAAVRRALPDEDIVYLGDTARVPYGVRSAETVIRYARNCALHLRNRRVKLLVVACNTVSAVALDMLRVELDVPVLGVVTPGARAGVESTVSGRIGVIATKGTVASGAYVRAFFALSPRVEVFARPAPLLVPLVEEGWIDGEVPRLAVSRYLDAFRDDGIDTLVLGCTHYPILRDLITQVGRQIIDPELSVIDSATAVADDLSAFLDDRDLKSIRRGQQLEILVTDLPDAFRVSASRFLGQGLDGVQVRVVDL